jgi:hypothetical protein
VTLQGRGRAACSLSLGGCVRNHDGLGIQLGCVAVRLTKQDQLRQALVLDGADPAVRKRNQFDKEDCREDWIESLYHCEIAGSLTVR